MWNKKLFESVDLNICDNLSLQTLLSGVICKPVYSLVINSSVIMLPI